jgi:hypothetical protein
VLHAVAAVLDGPFLCPFGRSTPFVGEESEEEGRIERRAAERRERVVSRAARDVEGGRGRRAGEGNAGRKIQQAAR